MSKLSQTYTVANSIRDICKEQKASGTLVKVRVNKNEGFEIALKDLRSDAMRERVKAEVERLLGAVIVLKEEKPHILIYEVR